MSLKLSSFKPSSQNETLIKETLISILENKSLGFLNLPRRETLWLDSEKMGAEIRNHYDHLVVVGIGGSSMGPRALAEFSANQNISFLDNVDSIETENILKKISVIKKIAWLFISKSGSTIEVLWTLELIHQRYTELHENLWPHTYFITEKTKNTLYDLSLKHQRPCLEIPLDVGGRFSVLSPVGLVIASYLNMDLEQIKNGALVAMKDTTQLELMLHQFLSSLDRQEVITLFWFYCSRMRWFGGWLQQLWAESLGKKMDRTGHPAFEFSTPMTSIGACDQHSILQQVIEGPKNKFVCVFRFKEIESSSSVIQNPILSETSSLKGKKFGDLLKAEALATQKALDVSGVSTFLFEFDHYNAETLGYLFMSFQIVVATLAEIKNINAFDQPAVSLGKKLISEYI